MDDLNKGFNSIYIKKLWGNKDNVPFFSGFGSSFKPSIDSYVNIIKQFTKNSKKKLNVIDIGCGDFNIGKELLLYFNNYTAVDVVDPLIEYNKNKFKNLNVCFKSLDITKNSIPFTDVIILRQVFQHLSNRNIYNALKNIYLKSKDIILTETIPSTPFVPNLDIKSGAKTRFANKDSGVDIISPPFNFPIQEKILTFMEEQTVNKKPKNLSYINQTIIYKQYE